MELKPPLARLVRREVFRLIPSRYPSVGIFDAVASAEDLEAIFDLEGWTNDRISAELGVLHTIPRDEWLIGRPLARVVMAAFCHPRPDGGRFNDPSRGAWYAVFTLRTAHAVAIYHRTRELEEIGGWFDTFVQMAAYLADVDAAFHDLRARRFSTYLNPDSYAASQRLGRRMLDRGSNGIVYPSVRYGRAPGTGVEPVSRASGRSSSVGYARAGFTSIDGRESANHRSTSSEELKAHAEQGAFRHRGFVTSGARIRL